jgi:excisionase family DNA binding protein
VSARLEAAVAELVAALREEVAPAAPTPDRLLSVDEAAAALSIGRTAVYGELAAGRLRSVRLGRRRLIPSSAISDRIAR